MLKNSPDFLNDGTYTQKHFDDLISEFVGLPIVFISPARKFYYANRNARDLLDIKNGTDISSMNCCDILKMDICKKGCPITRIKCEGEVVNDYFVKRACSDVRYCVSTSVVNDSAGKKLGIIHSIKDMDMVMKIVEEQKRTQEMLEIHQLKMQAILESIADGIFSVNRDGDITHFNKSMEKITGFPAKEVLGKSCKSVLKGGACESDCPIRWSVRESERIETCKEIIVSREGKTIPVNITTSPIMENGVVIGVVCSVNDRTEIELLRNELAKGAPFREIVGQSKRMGDLYTSIESVSETDVNVLIEGETGTGKELVARAIHQRSNRNRAPFVTVNCSALPLFLLESELFGHVKGAFTGAVKDRKGKFEAAEGGTLFLDEISEISHDIQLKLLRFLQSKEFEMVGETRTRKVDVRIIAATNKNMLGLVNDGKFREDLFYRLNVFPVKVPPLRERREDIPLLVEHFLDKHRKLNPSTEGISSRAFKHLIEYNWPGNVRQLENAVMYGMTSSPSKKITRAFIPPEISKLPLEEKTSHASRPYDHHDAMSIEKMRIVRALTKHNWQVTRAAESLSYSRTTLWRRMKKLSITLPNRNNM